MSSQNYMWTINSNLLIFQTENNTYLLIGTICPHKLLLRFTLHKTGKYPNYEIWQAFVHSLQWTSEHNLQFSGLKKWSRRTRKGSYPSENNALTNRIQSDVKAMAASFS